MTDFAQPAAQKSARCHDKSCHRYSVGGRGLLQRWEEVKVRNLRISKTIVEVEILDFLYGERKI